MPLSAGQQTRTRAVLSIAVGLFLAAVEASAQEPPPAPADVHVHEEVAVSAPALTPTRETSGTAWLPAATPMYGVHNPWRGWDIRVNGAAFVQAIYEPGDRHRTGGAATGQGGSRNWAMGMIRRQIGGGRLGVRTMLSAEPWTVPSCGSLSLLATGEVCDGETVHDRQEPHDLFMELAVDYERGLLRNWRWQVYAALAGEPALGPAGYPHRASAMANPAGPIAHHWLDDTHVAFGVVTAGVHNLRWKVEMSVFNGRQPDESRTDLDLGAFDSYSTRLSYLATERLALQVSAGRLREARTDFSIRPPDPLTRVTASAVYHVPLAADGIWATTAAFGTNHAAEFVSGIAVEDTTAAALLESSVTLAGRHTIFGRAEVVGMPAHHLHAHEYSPSIFTVAKVQGGYVRHLRPTRGLVPGLGASAALSLLPDLLASRYSGRFAPSIAVFFSLQAARHQM